MFRLLKQGLRVGTAVRTITTAGSRNNRLEPSRTDPFKAQSPGSNKRCVKNHAQGPRKCKFKKSRPSQSGCWSEETHFPGFRGPCRTSQARRTGRATKACHLRAVG